MAGPVSPKEITKLKKTSIPEPVFEVINKLIAKYWNGFSATIKQKDIVWALINTIQGSTSDSIRENGWLNFEDCYRAEGWQIEYDRPGYNETYDAEYTFSKRKK